MKEDEIIKQILAIGLSLSIKEIDYNRAVEIAKETLIEHEKLVKNLTITDVSNNEEQVSFCEVCESKKEFRQVQVCVNEQCMCRYRAK